MSKIIQTNFSLKNLNTFGFNIAAERYAELKSYDDYHTLINNCDIKKENILILGEGSNILFLTNFTGLVIKSGFKGISVIDETPEHVILEIGSGENWDELVDYCVQKNYGGIENLSAIPGTVGAAPIQNIGAYGVEFEEVFVSLEGIDLLEDKIITFVKSECNFGYRESIFKSEYKNRILITKVRIKLNTNPKLVTTYRAIKDYLDVNKIDADNLDVQKIREIVCDIRSSKLPDPTEIGNAGSFFKNPIISGEHLKELKKSYNDLVFFKISENEIKIPAGWLIEKLGFKGFKYKNVGVHKNQALVLVNYGSGSGEEIFELSEKINNKIKENFNIILDTEVNIV